MAMQSPSYSCSFSYGFKYQVFLSFRGSDTRYGFTGNLYKALTDKGIHTFIDDRVLQRGDEIKPSLDNAIDESRIFIPVFSANYASSSFCLDELVHIIHCYKEHGRLVLPVFLGVDPSHVRHHKGSYGEALAKHEERFQNNTDNMERLRKWKIALTQAANFSGDHRRPGFEYKLTGKISLNHAPDLSSDHCSQGYEYDFIGEIVKYIANKINRVPLHVAKYPVGLQSRVQQVKSLLDKGSNDVVHMVGLYGTGGLGKSTLAKAIFNSIADQFEGLCFLANVRENSAKHSLEHLQEELLLKTIGLEIKLGCVSQGIPIIKDRLHRKKVLLILDDVDKLEQLDALAGGFDWFGTGSRVIITTRDKHLLTNHEIEILYEVEGLYGTEALELLRWMAFKNNKVPSSYTDILNRSISYASGLPLVIEIVGSNLFGKTIEEWKGTLDGYEKIPNKKIQEILKVSYDALEEEEQSVFLDIACCFKGCAWEEFEYILHAHYGHCIKHHVRVLAEKSLIKICEWQLGDIRYVTLHDLIEDMGKEVVRQQSPKEPGERSRLWCRDDIVHVLQENTGTGKVEMIYMNCPSMKAVIDWNGKALKKMINLKTLIIKGGHFFKGSPYFPSGLRVLEWKRYPLKCIPFSISNKTFEKMTILKLNNCEYLTNISDVSCLPNLEKFSFKNCKNLITIHDSIGFLSQLEILNAKGCDKLLSFPPLKLSSLRELKLSGCTRLKIFPEILGKMKNITSIGFKLTGIEELPFSFQNLTELNGLFIFGRGKLKLPSSIFMMSNLEDVYIYGYSPLLPKLNDEFSSMVSSNVKDILFDTCSQGFLTIALTWFSNVESLDLKGSNIKILPEFLKKCLFLKRIDLDKCQYLEEVRGIPPNLKKLSALYCKSLTSSSKSMLVSQELHEDGGTMFCFPTSRSYRIPKWFEHQTRERSICFLFCNNIPSLVFSFSCKRMHEFSIKGTLPAMRGDLVINDHKYDIHLGLKLDHTSIFSFDVKYWSEESIQTFTPVEYRKFKSMLDEALSKNEWIHAELLFWSPEKDWYDEVVVETGIHVNKHLTNMDDIRIRDPSLGKCNIVHSKHRN